MLEWYNLKEGGGSQKGERNKTIILWAGRPVCVRQGGALTDFYLSLGERNKMT